jgi:hypothetical protein
MLPGCGRSGPASTETDSTSFATLQSKIDFLHNHVSFRRNYLSLEFSIFYRDGSAGGLPSPSDWDIRLIAQVPPEELGQWVPPGGQPVATVDTGWLTIVPGSEKAAGIKEWYLEPRRVIGIDRNQGVVAYRIWAD